MQAQQELFAIPPRRKTRAEQRKEARQFHKVMREIHLRNAAADIDRDPIAAAKSLKLANQHKR